MLAHVSTSRVWSIRNPRKRWHFGWQTLTDEQIIALVTAKDDDTKGDDDLDKPQPKRVAADEALEAHHTLLVFLQGKPDLIDDCEDAFRATMHLQSSLRLSKPKTRRQNSIWTFSALGRFFCRLYSDCL
jgi:hypothetical protein